VDFNSHQGLFESMELVVGERSYTHMLGYINMPFRCLRCHKVGHILADFELPFQRRFLGNLRGPSGGFGTSPLSKLTMVVKASPIGHLASVQ
jgi:hypothetical protein